MLAGWRPWKVGQQGAGCICPPGGCATLAAVRLFSEDGLQREKGLLFRWPRSPDEASLLSCVKASDCGGGQSCEALPERDFWFFSSRRKELIFSTPAENINQVIFSASFLKPPVAVKSSPALRRNFLHCQSRRRRK